MKIDVENVSPIEKKVTVEVDPERVGKELDRAYVALGRRVKLRGFRAGKVPRKVLERHFREEVERDVVQKLVATSFTDAVRESSIDAIAPPRVDIAEPGLQAAQPFRFTARVEVKPKLDPKDYRGLEAARKPVEVTDAQVQDELVRIQDGMAQLVPVEGRFDAREGDFATIDHEATVDGQPFEGSKAEGITVRVAQGDLAEGYLPQLAGAKLGDAVELDQAFPPDHRVEALRGKTGHFKVTLKALSERKVPPLDDELAKDLGMPEVDSLEKLRQRVRDDLAQRAQRRSDAELKDALIKAALARNDFEVPPALVERAVDVMIQGAAERFARQGLDLAQMGLDVARLRADLREGALLEVKGALLLEAIADRENITVSEEEIQERIARSAQEARLPLAQVQNEMRNPQVRASLASRLREDKALAFLTSEAKLT